MKRLIIFIFLFFFTPFSTQAQLLRTDEQRRKLFGVGFTDAVAKNPAYQLPNAGIGYKIGWEKFGFSPFISGHSLGGGAYFGKEAGLFVGAGFKFWGADRRGDVKDSTRLSVLIGVFSTDLREKFSKWHAGGSFDIGLLGESNRKELPRFYVSRSFLDILNVRSLGNTVHIGPYIATTGLGGSLTFGPEKKTPFRVGVGIGLEWDALFDKELEVETNVFFGLGL